MYKKGFTLTELLAVIVIIALLSVAAVPAVISIGNNNKKNMFCKKIQTIEKSAELYGEDYFDNINNTESPSYLMDGNQLCLIKLGNSVENQRNQCQLTTVENLATKGYVNYEKAGKNGATTEVLDPRTSKSIKPSKVMIYIVNKRIHAKYIYDTKKDATECTTGIKVGNKTVKELYYRDETSTDSTFIIQKDTSQ